MSWNVDIRQANSAAPQWFLLFDYFLLVPMPASSSRLNAVSILSSRRRCGQPAPDFPQAVVWTAPFFGLRAESGPFSDLPLKADIRVTRLQVSFGPKGDIG